MKNFLHKITKMVASVVVVFFGLNTVLTPVSYAQIAFLPEAGVMVSMTSKYSPMVIKGVKIDKENPFRFDFIVDTGDTHATTAQIKEEGTKLISYFLASLTTPEKEMWVNLSPYEKNRIIPESFGQTEMGKDVLAQDYMLKQIMATALYPERELGRAFWQKIYADAAKKFGTTQVPINTFNKVWILPNEAVVYENSKMNSVFVVKSTLKVMLEEDYLATSKNTVGVGSKPTRAGYEPAPTNINQLGSQIIKDLVIPALEKEVNEGKSFATLRQVYQSLILATWYKNNLKDSVLTKGYADRNKTQGVNVNDPAVTQKIYEQYLKAYRKGVYNFVKEEMDPASNKVVPRKYFSGGVNAIGLQDKISRAMTAIPEMVGDVAREFVISAGAEATGLTDEAMTAKESVALSQRTLEILAAKKDAVKYTTQRLALAEKLRAVEHVIGEIENAVATQQRQSEAVRPTFLRMVDDAKAKLPGVQGELVKFIRNEDSAFREEMIVARNQARRELNAAPAVQIVEPVAQEPAPALVQAPQYPAQPGTPTARGRKMAQPVRSVPATAPAAPVAQALVQAPQYPAQPGTPMARGRMMAQPVRSVPVAAAPAALVAPASATVPLTANPAQRLGQPEAPAAPKKGLLGRSLAALGGLFVATWRKERRENVRKANETVAAAKISKDAFNNDVIGARQAAWRTASDVNKKKEIGFETDHLRTQGLAGLGERITVLEKSIAVLDGSRKKAAVENTTKLNAALKGLQDFINGLEALKAQAKEVAAERMNSVAQGQLAPAAPAASAQAQPTASTTAVTPVTERDRVVQEMTGIFETFVSDYHDLLSKNTADLSDQEKNYLSALEKEIQDLRNASLALTRALSNGKNIFEQTKDLNDNDSVKVQGRQNARDQFEQAKNNLDDIMQRLNAAKEGKSVESQTAQQQAQPAQPVTTTPVVEPRTTTTSAVTETAAVVMPTENGLRLSPVAQVIEQTYASILHILNLVDALEAEIEDSLPRQRGVYLTAHAQMREAIVLLNQNKDYLLYLANGIKFSSNGTDLVHPEDLVVLQEALKTLKGEMDAFPQSVQDFIPASQAGYSSSIAQGHVALWDTQKMVDFLSRIGTYQVNSELQKSGISRNEAIRQRAFLIQWVLELNRLIDAVNSSKTSLELESRMKELEGYLAEYNSELNILSNNMKTVLNQRFGLAIPLATATPTARLVTSAATNPNGVGVTPLSGIPSVGQANVPGTSTIIDGAKPAAPAAPVTSAVPVQGAIEPGFLPATPPMLAREEVDKPAASVVEAPVAPVVTPPAPETPTSPTEPAATVTKKSRLASALKWIGLSLAALGLGFLVYDNNQKGTVIQDQTAQIAALKQQIDAEKTAKEAAEQAKKTAEAATKAAETAKAAADSRAANAETLARQAEVARQAAETAQRVEVDARQKAEVARIAAEAAKSRVEAAAKAARNKVRATVNGSAQKPRITTTTLDGVNVQLQRFSENYRTMVLDYVNQLRGKSNLEINAAIEQFNRAYTAGASANLVQQYAQAVITAIDKFKNNQAMTSPLGGIDLEKVVVEARRSGNGVTTAFSDPAVLAALLKAQGLRPIIYSIKPVTLPMMNMLLGLNTTGAANDNFKAVNDNNSVPKQDSAKAYYPKLAFIHEEQELA